MTDKVKRSMALLLLAALFIGVVCLYVFGCGKGEKDKPDPEKDVLVVLRGGLGSDQTTELANEIRKRCPRAEVVEAEKFNGFNDDIHGITDGRVKKYLVLLGHSYGGEGVIDDCAAFEGVDLLVVLDPVKRTHALALPKNVRKYLYLIRAKPDIVETADVAGAESQTVPDTDHNSICHSPLVFDIVSEAINNLGKD